MSNFWHWWVIGLVVLNWTLVTFLLIVATRVKIPTREDGTTGHVWAHGVIREGVRKLPLWWVLLSIGSLCFAVAYLYQYPGFGNTAGSLGWSASQQVKDELSDNAKRQFNFNQDLFELPLNELAKRPEVLQSAGVLFAENCAGCHGNNGQGNSLIGAPNLADDSWLHGASDNIKLSIENGRQGTMPAFGQLTDIQLHEVAEYVYTLNGRAAEHTWALAPGKQRFEMSCAVCHGQNGHGNQTMGAPNLADGAWLYSGEMAGIIKTVRDGRHGVMPGWKDRLSETDIRLLLVWIEALSDTTDSENVSHH
ncbi:MAG: cytochrome-c oxidase, cbb3-type subunit III [Oceanococcus sp.]